MFDHPREPHSLTRISNGLGAPGSASVFILVSTYTLLITGLEAKPKLSELQKYVRPVAAEKWEDVGIALGLADDDDGNQFDIIKEEKKGDSNQCFNELMKLWLRSGAPCTWATLIAAMRSVTGLEYAAKQILATSKPIARCTSSA